MVNWNDFREVAENVAYRFEDQRYSHADEYGEHAYTSYDVRLRVYAIIKYTKCGYWINTNWGTQNHQPRQVTWEQVEPQYRRFVNLEANKRFALPTIDEAVISYVARKQRAISIYNARAKAAQLHIDVCLSKYGKGPATPIIPK